MSVLKFLALQIVALLLLGLNLIISDGVPYFYSSLVIILGILYVIAVCGPISVPVFYILCIFVPALAFFWRDLRGADYINFHNHWLQDNIFYVNSAVAYSAIALVVALSFFCLRGFRSFSYISLSSEVSYKGYSVIYLLCIFGALFFFWLTDPSFTTIFQVSYAEILDARFEGTQYAGSIAVIFWSIAFVFYSSCISSDGFAAYPRNNLHYFFLLASALVILWLVLHARRSELIGIGLIALMMLKETKGSRRALLVAGVFLVILIGIEEVRNLISAGGLGIAQPSFTVASLPGGASNVFMTLINSIHYFEFNDYFYGETFVNYFYQILPTNIYFVFGLAKPAYFFETVFSNYSYNGGTYVGALFFGNFGWLGAYIFGGFVFLYTFAMTKLIQSSAIFHKAFGIFLIVLMFRANWYELTMIIKPVFIIFLPLLIFEMALRRSSIITVTKNT